MTEFDDYGPCDDVSLANAGLEDYARMLEEEDRMDPEDEIMANEHRQMEIIRKAVEAADRIILDGSNGTVEETNYLTAAVARKFMEKALHPLSSVLLAKEINDRHMKRMAGE